MVIKTNKKAAVEVQFNWIFVLIIGAVIFVFFFSLIMKQKQLSEQTTADEVLSQLELKISGAKVSARTADSIPIPKMDFQFKCDLDSCTDYACTSFYSVKNKNLQGKSYSISPVFAPDVVKGTSMTTWTLDWNVPYRVTNFVYVSSPLVKYIVVKDSSNSESDNAKLAQAIYGAIPTQKTEDGIEILFNKEIISADLSSPVTLSSTSKGNYKVKFIFVDASSAVTLDTTFKDVDVSAINIISYDSAKGIDGSGSVAFYKKEGMTLSQDGSDSEYMGKASLFGAVFSENEEAYECNMKKAFNSLRIVSNIYVNRTKLVYNYYNEGMNSECYLFPIYSSKASPYLNSMSKYRILDSSEMYSTSKELQTLNNNLIKQSCIMVY